MHIFFIEIHVINKQDFDSQALNVFDVVPHYSDASQDSLLSRARPRVKVGLRIR